MRSREQLEKERKRGEYCKGKVERKQKEKRRSDSMTKAEWEDKKKNCRMTRVGYKMKCLRRGKK